MNKGFSLDELHGGGFVLVDLQEAGFGASALMLLGHSAESLRSVGFSAEELHVAGFTAADLHGGGFCAPELHQAGFGTVELRGSTGRTRPRALPTPTVSGVTSIRHISCVSWERRVSTSVSTLSLRPVRALLATCGPSGT